MTAAAVTGDDAAAPRSLDRTRPRRDARPGPPVSWAEDVSMERRPEGASAAMDLTDAQRRVQDADAQASTLGRGPLLSTYAVRHRRGLDVAFLLDGDGGDVQIGMGAASEDFRSVRTIGVDQEHGRLRAVSSWIVDGRTVHVPVRILLHSPTAILVEAAHLPLDRRPAALKCWSFLRRDGVDHHSAVFGFVSPELAGLPAVRFVTDPRTSSRPPARQAATL